MRIFLILLGFQITWFACVFGEFFNYPWLGILVGLAYLVLFFLDVNDKKFALKTILIFSAIGYVFDSSIQAFNIYKIESDLIIGFLPAWMLILWPTFTTLFVDVLNFLRNQGITLKRRNRGPNNGNSSLIKKQKRKENMVKVQVEN